jgi:hypothetical protein
MADYMQSHLHEIVSLHRKITERYPRELADLFVDQLTLCFFMDGMRLFADGFEFKEQLIHAGRNPQKFSSHLNKVFSTVFSDTGGMHLLSSLNETVNLVIDEIDHINRIGSLGWSNANPFIFGRVFELTLEVKERSQLGVHYTPENDILDLIDPVILRNLRDHLERVKVKINLGASDIEKRDLVRPLLHEIRSVRILDPACGTGNFLLVCLRSLLDLEKEAIQLAEGVFETIPCVTLSQFYGIEKDPRAFRLMRVVLWIGYTQWMHKNFDKDMCVDLYSIPDSRNFMSYDAILDLSDSSLPKERDWPDVDFIIGNPPYLGASRMRKLLGEEYVDILNWVFDGRVPGSADFGCYWVEKARDMIDRGRVKSAGFVVSATIRQEWSRPVLDRVNQSGKIFFAISDRVWGGKEAAVHVSLIGFTGMIVDCDFILDGRVVPVIHSNLSSNHNASELRQVKNRLYECLSGTGDVLEDSVDERVALELIRNLSTDELNFLRPFIGGRDLVQGSSNRWTKWDVDNSSEEGGTFRGKRFLVTPRVSKHSVFLWLDSVVLTDSGIVMWGTDDDYVFGILQSRVHRVWTLANCGWRGETRNYQIKSCFRSFVFPCVDDLLEDEIRGLAARLNKVRNDWLYPEKLIKKEYVKFCSFQGGPWQNYSIGEFGCGLIRVDYPLYRPINSVAEKILEKKTVTGLYNDNPDWLREAHRDLDIMVLRAYGWDEGISDEEIVTGLKILNSNRSGGLLSD